MSMSYEMIVEEFAVDFNRKILAAESNLQNKAMAAQAFFFIRKANDSVPYIPWDDGDLFATQEVHKPIIKAGSISIDFGFTSPYAAYQHRGERKDGSRKVVNRKRAGSGPNYLTSKLFKFRFEAIQIGAKELMLGLAK